jgi:competence protein ComEC
MLVASHADDDHVGGVAAVERAFEITTVRHGGVRPQVLAPATSCRRGEAWFWDDVRFEFVHPAPSERWDDNNGSCVLLISSQSGSALLTGDIEADAEATLMTRSDALHADLVVVPHHGSRSSSSEELVRIIGARYAIVSAGAGNRWGFPSAVVVDRWCAAGTEVIDTANWGATTVRFASTEDVARPHSQRLEQRRYWHSTTPQAGRSLCRRMSPRAERNSPPKQMFMRSGR